MKTHVEDVKRRLTHLMRKETDEKVMTEIKERLQVPGLVGDNQPFSTLSSFLVNWHSQINQDRSEASAASTAMLSRVVMLESRTDTLVREFENASKVKGAEIANLEREISRHRVMMNNTRTRMEEVAKNSRPFTAD